MACPFFCPEKNDFAGAARPHPLGDVYGGTCLADPSAPLPPGERTLRELCNMGYARRECSRFPTDAAIDAIRFAITRDAAGLIGVAYVTERNHLPATHGTLEYSRAADAFGAPHPDRLIQRQAEAYLASYLRRQAHAA